MNSKRMQEFLVDWNRDLLAYAVLDDYPVPTGEWFGREPASALELAAWEDAHQLSLPPSYRAFLELSNGWNWLGPVFAGPLHSLGDVSRFAAKEPDLVELYRSAPEQDPSEAQHAARTDDPSYFRSALLDDALQIVDYDGDDGVYLLVPTIQTAEGEWEAWHFANWYAGAHRVPTFFELLLAQRANLQTYLKEQSDWVKKLKR